jgi:hypothetical protein
VAKCRSMAWAPSRKAWNCALPTAMASGRPMALRST